ncbi:D-alanyl-D-alanine carboxypeptidase [Alcanivorax sp. S6407]|uniref:D-alanyl-D-alanine carboxypeptidase family protein n=1 Tax=Alcanivorax sp. S6407 TaxID=2926424 RepID=UPI001FF57684|nr:D-alanyl-D-alanine carboxypeptidase family protein [Alcanivorax sp. S6407]MCK0153269.1 D-alanyl-D-alanine carboxypeptidase [Alcanivorax sp. S6407]
MRSQSIRSSFFVLFAFIGSLMTVQASASMVPRAPQIDARGYLLMDAASGRIIVEHNAEQRLPPASLTKMMTAYIAEAELQKGNLSEDDMAPVSVKAWRMGGSKMFIKEGTRVSVGDLLKGIIIQSGNDASVAMAEFVAGSEDAFADLMNQHARRLGMHSTHFMNATGWPAENHFTTAKDMATLARAIVRDFPEHYDTYAQKEFTYNGITQQNRNLLLWRDERVDGLKTGHTEEAGYCLVSSAKDGDMRLIAVVMGTDSEGARARESQKLLTYGFRFFETYKAYSAGDILDTAELWMGEQREVRLGLAEDLILTIPKESHENLKAEVTVNPQLQAPINQGQQYGTVTVRMDNEVLVEKPLVALESIEEAGFLTKIWHHILMFFQSLF